MCLFSFFLRKPPFSDSKYILQLTVGEIKSKLVFFQVKHVADLRISEKKPIENKKTIC